MEHMRSILSKAGMSLLLAACLSACSSGKKMCCRAVQVDGGYGYVILNRGDTLIYQPYIPVLGGRQPFRTEQEALEVGQLVYRKLRAGYPPTVDRAEVERCLERAGE